MKKMPNLLSLSLAALLGTLAACSSPPQDPNEDGHDGPPAGETMRNASLNNAIISQHTLYPYHFAAGSAVLNDLGQRDLHVLADHFVKTGGDLPGELNVRRGNASEALYEARVKVVLEHLAAAGVHDGLVAVKDGPPGGEGMASERVIVILKEKMAKQATSSSGSGSSTGSTSGVGIQ